MAIQRERLDRIDIGPDGKRWGQFEVSDIELFSYPPSHVRAEIVKCANRLGLDAFSLTVHRPSDRSVQIVYGPMRHSFQQEDEEVAGYVSNRRHIDLSILE
jgi:hypothetical protein